MLKFSIGIGSYWNYSNYGSICESVFT